MMVSPIASPLPGSEHPSASLLRYSTAADGSKLVPMLQGGAVSKKGRRRVPTGQCHAVPWWAPARALCGRLTERMALWPQDDFTQQRVDVCPQCSTAVREEPELRLERHS